MKPLMELSDGEIKALWTQVSGWDQGMREYKGWSVWGDVLEKWVDEKFPDEKVFFRGFTFHGIG